MKKQALGRGLSALIPTEKKQMLETLARDQQKQEQVVEIPLASLKPNKLQPRQNFSDTSLEELAASIREKGIILPITVRQVDSGYEIIAGERRYRAAVKLNLPTIPAIIKQVSDQEALELALIENLQRDDLNPIEKAKGFQQLITQFNLRHEDIAKKTGLDRSSVSNILRLLELPESIQEKVSRGTISFGHARALLSLPTVHQQEEVCTIILKKFLSVRQTENLVKRIKSGHKGLERKTTPAPEVAHLEEQIQRALGTKVRLSVRGKKGKIEIEFHSLDELDRILLKLGVKPE
ncbi:MAG: ParB/RepB/Spo0J family partition protein [bacterium]|nr:ParB/RepB/Spo0J family partition protein [bacterium]